MLISLLIKSSANTKASMWIAEREAVHPHALWKGEVYVHKTRMIVRYSRVSVKSLITWLIRQNAGKVNVWACFLPKSSLKVPETQEKLEKQQHI